ncbi:DUF2145 domain-containing protein [Thalassotalea sp. ND16A]|uniref:DUF2145 domain-containing protein n=1 Tax=Thalassotalea sp. ND16A TaxID=1535422 RepID=UPI00051A32BC|nr:DUF2145 domain-containing protein [Thalassotalea sp. ND16A]
MKALIKTLILSLVFVNASVWAGSASPTDNQHDTETLTGFAKNVEKYAASQGAQAFIIGRVGRPEKDLPKGVAFTHAAIAIYSSIELENGETIKGYAIHNLYQKQEKKHRSSLVTDYPIDFFWGVDALKAGIIIPTVELQAKLIDAIATGKNKDVHNPKYSVLSNPFDGRYQNCTEHTLDVINAAIYGTTEQAQLKANAKAYFKPQRIRTNPVKLLLGSIFLDDVKLKDHQGKVKTATFTSIGKYLQSNQLLAKAVILDEQGNSKDLL